MKLYLKRQYFPGGTNGKITYQNAPICETIELPWQNNKKRISCIPSGRYRLTKRVHPRHGEQLYIPNVPGREDILIHPANFALRELQGCIAPVTKCTGQGLGLYSRIAYERLEALIAPVLAAGQTVWLFIQ